MERRHCRLSKDAVVGAARFLCARFVGKQKNRGEKKIAFVRFSYGKSIASVRKKYARPCFYAKKYRNSPIFRRNLSCRKASRFGYHSYQKNADVSVPTFLSRYDVLQVDTPTFHTKLFDFLNTVLNDARYINVSKEVVEPQPEGVQIIAPENISFQPIKPVQKAAMPTFKPLHEHKYVPEEVKPSCIRQGCTLYKCECGESYKTNIRPVLAHDYKKSKTLLPSCTQQGQEIYECTTCGGTQIQYTPMTSHSFGAWTMQKYPTCTEQGLQAKQCGVCGLIENKTLPAEGHDFGKWIVTTKPLCTQAGEQTRQCQKCGAIEKTPLPAEGHSFGKKTLVRKPTCTQEGEESRSCPVCGFVENTPIPVVPHKMGAWKKSKTDRTKEERHCKNCDYVETKPRNEVKQQRKAKRNGAPFFWLALLTMLGDILFILYCNALPRYLSNTALLIILPIAALVFLSISIGISRSKGTFRGFKKFFGVIFVIVCCNIILASCFLAVFSEKAVYRDGVLLVEQEYNEEYTIVGCPTAVKDVVLPSSVNGKNVKAIEESAFFGNDSLSTVIVSDGITTIRSNAFRDCDNITSVWLPASIQYIFDYSFAYCHDFTLYYEGTQYQWSRIYKTEKWYNNTGVVQVVCTDGTLFYYGE